MILGALAVALLACDAGPLVSLDPEVARSIDARHGAGLRYDRAWVEAVIADPDSVVWNGIRVSPDEAALMQTRRVREAMDVRAGVGLPADEATVRALLADPTTVMRQGVIPLSPAEAKAWDARAATSTTLIPALMAYGTEHPEDWGDVFVEDDGAVVVSFSSHLDAHRRAVEALLVPGSVAVEVRQVRWPIAALDPITEQIGRDLAWFDREGIQLWGDGVSPKDNLVVVEDTTPKPRDGIEDLIIEHFDARGKMRVDATVRRPLNIGRGTLTVTVVDVTGRPVPEVWCVLDPDVPGAAGESTGITSDEHGVCHWDPIGATGFGVEIWRGYEWGFLGAGRVVVARGQDATLTVIVPVP